MKQSFAGIRERGFTLVELVITIILIGILSAVVMININAKSQHSVTVQADQFRRDLSHIQLLAISRGVRLKLTTASTGYTVTCISSNCTTTTVTDPATGQNFSVTLTDGVTFSSTSISTLDFDSLGRPQSGGSLITTIPARSYTLSGSGRSVSVTVLPITGFARTAY